jgi:hypothetical protein
MVMPTRPRTEYCSIWQETEDGLYAPLSFACDLGEARCKPNKSFDSLLSHEAKFSMLKEKI